MRQVKIDDVVLTSAPRGKEALQNILGRRLGEITQQELLEAMAATPQHDAIGQIQEIPMADLPEEDD